MNGFVLLLPAQEKTSGSLSSLYFAQPAKKKNVAFDFLESVKKVVWKARATPGTRAEKLCVGWGGMGWGGMAPSRVGLHLARLLPLGGTTQPPALPSCSRLPASCWLPPTPWRTGFPSGPYHADKVDGPRLAPARSTHNVTCTFDGHMTWRGKTTVWTDSTSVLHSQLFL